MAQLPDVLDRSVRCIMGIAGSRGPVLSPLAFWCDGAELWMTTPAASVKANVLRQRPSCSVYVPPPQGLGTGAIVSGTMKMYGLHNPVSLAVHGPVVSTAMAALAARNAGTILGYAQDARSVPQQFRPHNRVALRLRIDRVEEVQPLEAGPGVAPALPTVVAPEVRRALAGQRRVVFATTAPDGSVDVTPAVWSAGFGLSLPAGWAPTTPRGAGAVYVGKDPQGRPTQVVGLSLSGEYEGATFTPQRATWWEGFRLRTVDIPAAASPLQLPD